VFVSNAIVAIGKDQLALTRGSYLMHAGIWRIVACATTVVRRQLSILRISVRTAVLFLEFGAETAFQRGAMRRSIPVRSWSQAVPLEVSSMARDLLGEIVR